MSDFLSRLVGPAGGSVFAYIYIFGSTGGCKCIVIISHMGRPAGDYKKEDFSLASVAKLLQQYLGPCTSFCFEKGFCVSACLGPAPVCIAVE